MPREHTITVYKFDELSPKAKKRALEEWQRLSDEHFDASSLTESFAYRLEELGLPHDKIGWRLSSSQGDGVAFYGKIDLEEHLKKNSLVKKYQVLAGLIDGGDLAVKIEKNRSLHMYDHYNTMDLEMDISRDLSPAEEKKVKELEEEIQEQIVAVSRQLEKVGYDEIEYQNSDEYLTESIEANDLEFDVSGNQI